MIKIGQFYRCTNINGEVIAMVVDLPMIGSQSFYKILNIESTNQFFPVGETVEVFDLKNFTRLKRPKLKVSKATVTKDNTHIGQMVFDEYFDLFYMVVGMSDDFVDTVIMKSDHVSFDVGEIMEVAIEDHNHAPLFSIPKWKEKK